MAYPTTLALITALWSGPARTRSIALWSALGGAIASPRPGDRRLPLAFLPVGLGLPGDPPSWRWWPCCWPSGLVPAHVNESTEPVDNLGGLLSALLVGAVILAINFAAGAQRGGARRRARRPGPRGRRGLLPPPAPRGTRCTTCTSPGRRIFWVAACAGIIVFGSLMGATFIGQQFLQNVLRYSTLDAGLAILPAVVCMVLVAPRSARLVETRGARSTLLIGYVFCLLGFLTMLLLWGGGQRPYWQVGLGYAFLGTGVGFAGTPASHSLTGSVPVERAGMASGTADLQRDLGGAIMTSIFGALLTAGFASAMGAGGGRRSGRRERRRQHDRAAHQVVRQRRGHGPAVPAVRPPDHGRREGLVPGRRPVGLPGRDRRHPARGGAGLPVPEAGHRAAPARRVPRYGHAWPGAAPDVDGGRSSTCPRAAGLGRAGGEDESHSKEERMAIAVSTDAAVPRINVGFVVLIAGGGAGRVPLRLRQRGHQRRRPGHPGHVRPPAAR